ncbi:protein SPIRAL1-like 5 [Cajanus cajan]|uniref:Protein SPIRAL1-like 2 n=1 Tax=Cajanus cajan TaxID=3821 RepID=A0A151SV52_CAJCA|nr:protein SPIRAL1-like 5 [Cajanus cajan]KYP58639.1 hypothetical protein KK1_014055 [Cajanus cajan]
MKRGESSGGGQSTLNYLFGSEELQSCHQPPPPNPKPPLSLPPYGIDNPPNAPASSQGQNLGNNILTNRPSTKVKSVPGGHSSLGYLFGDK